MAKPTRCDCIHRNEPSDMSHNGWYLYILLLTDCKYYVGISKHLTVRLRKHFRGEGAKWTMKNPPIAIHQVKPVVNTDYDSMRVMENMFTLAMMKQHGIDPVRGGSFVKSFPWSQAERKGLGTLLKDMKKLKAYR